MLGIRRCMSISCRRGLARPVARMEGSEPDAEFHAPQFSIDWCVPYSYSMYWSDRSCLPLAGTVLGIALLVTFMISIAAIVQRNHVTVGLVLLNWTLLLDFIAIVVIGTYVWFHTLQERNNYFERYKDVTADVRVQIQDKVCRSRSC